MPRIRMVGSFGVVGEDRTDWLPETEHDASEEYASKLIARGVAVLVPVALEEEEEEEGESEEEEEEGESEEKEQAEGLTTENAAPVNRMSRPPRRR